MARSIDVADGAVAVTVSLTTPGCPIRSHFENAVREAVGGPDGVTGVKVGFDVLSDAEKGKLQTKLGRAGGLPEGSLAQVANVVCIGSGKGGVGKSTVTANLAAALVADGKRRRGGPRADRSGISPGRFDRQPPSPNSTTKPRHLRTHLLHRLMSHNANPQRGPAKPGRLYLRGRMCYWAYAPAGTDERSREEHPAPMSDAHRPQPPPLPAALLNPWPVIVGLATCWTIAAVLAFAQPDLHTWRPITVAGLGVGVLGTSIFLWQRHAARRGSKGAQSGLS